jgi:hypothetical protein
MQIRFIVTALLLSSGGVQASNEAESPQNLPGIRADDGIRYIEAARFPDIPSWVRQALIREKCAIPQTGLNEKPGNVVRGKFLSTDEFGWAAICRRDGRDDIIIVRLAGRTVIVTSERSGGWYETGEGREYLDYIGVIRANDARRAAKRFGEHVPTGVKTDGLIVGFAEKASGAQFWYRGKWIAFPLSD